MKTLTHFRLLLVALLGIVFFTLSCRREVEVPLPSGPTIDGKPSAASLGGTATGATGGDKMEFRVDLYVVDRSGRYVRGLTPNNFSITASAPTSFTYALSKLELVGQTAKPGGYSAMLLMDQSASIAYQQGSEPPTDPNDLRIAAGKVFLDFLGKDDYAALSSFSSASTYPNFIIYHSGFTNNVQRMKNSLDSLASTENGGTPLYYSAVEATNYTARNAKTTNKALIVFTDGINNQTGTVANTISNAKRQEIPIFTVGLSTGINVQVLSQMSNETGGAFFYAKDAEQLVTTFGTLGNLLRGSAQLYRTTWTATRRTGRWASGNTISETIKVTIPTGDVIEVPFYVSVP